MGYWPDLKRIPLMEFKAQLISKELLPSRRILLDNISEYFSAIQNAGGNNLHELKAALSAPAKMAAFSKKAAIPEAYLVILKREIGSLIPKTVPLEDFDILTSEDNDRLGNRGIKSSKEYYENYPLGDDWLAKEKAEILYSYCDLVRINGMGPLAAKMFFEAGYTCVAKIAIADAQEMRTRVNDLNDAKQYYDGPRLGLKDVVFCIDYASMLMKYA